MGFLDLAQHVYQAQNGGASGGGISPGTPVTATGQSTPVAAQTSTGAPSGGIGSLRYNIADRVSAITAKDSPLMRQARTTGLQTANRRGLINSSIAGGAAESAAISAATPIASQEMQQEYGWDVNAANNAKDERTAILNTYAQLSGDMMNAQSQTLSNDKIPSATRTAVQNSISGTFRAGMDFMSNLYGAKIGWGG